MARIQWVLALLSAFLALASASSSAPSFCKCTCFTNSTIIPLNPPHEQTPSDGTQGVPGRRAQRWPQAVQDNISAAAQALADTSPSSSPLLLFPRASTASCSRCNRAYCLSSGLPICRGAEEKDVLAVCFQRDSRKDEIIVWCFLIGVGGLLGWAAAKRVVEARGGGGSSGGGGQQPLLGEGDGRSGNSPSFFQRVKALFGRGGAPHNNARPIPEGGQWNPFSPTSAEPRGQYAPLGDSGTD